MFIFVRTEVMSPSILSYFWNRRFSRLSFFQFYTFIIRNFLTLKIKGTNKKRDFHLVGIESSWSPSSSYSWKDVSTSKIIMRQILNFTLQLHYQMWSKHLPSWHVHIRQSSWTCHCYQTMGGEFFPCHYTWDDVLKS